jgi:hypothetical protein
VFHLNRAAQNIKGRSNPRTERLRIDDLSAVGELLSREHLRGVTGGLRVGGNGFRSSWNTCNGDVGYDI